MRRQWLPALLCAALVAGCAAEKEGNRRDTMTQRQRDSTLAQTALPGAEGVGKALAASDSAKARQARMDSLTRP
jgi:hypothetical protein